jgi:alkanesulfonate monooxygenase SsuD/methylene tetrahydromethanopterin reductase-like flavin-dependent oxidoreductase (luciferase family)
VEHKTIDDKVLRLVHIETVHVSGRWFWAGKPLRMRSRQLRITQVPKRWIIRWRKAAYLPAKGWRDSSAEEVQCFPKPLQNPLPIYAGGNHQEVRRRAGELADGWLPAVLSPEEMKKGIEDVRRVSERAGRDPSKIDIAPQFAVSIGRTREEALKRFHASQLYKHMESLKTSTLREQRGGYEERNLIGSPEEISERIRRYQDIGVTTFAGLLFVATTVSEMREAIELFGREVLPSFR